MSRIGVLGGMGPAATVDFMDKLVQLTPAARDQDHVPVIVASLPQIPDRSPFILGSGADPWPALLAGLEALVRAGVGVIAIPCNSAHHWHSQISAASPVPVLHIAQASLQALQREGHKRAALLATRGALASGFYQREMGARAIECVVPPAQGTQAFVDDCIREVKAGNVEAAAHNLQRALQGIREQGVTAVIMGCTEIPIAARHVSAQGLAFVDSSLELARAAVTYALERGWSSPQGAA